MNELTIEVYSTGTTRLDDYSNDLAKAQDIRFETVYPGGLFGAASFYITRDIARYWVLNGAQRVVIRNGQMIVYEGKITGMISAMDTDRQGVRIECNGAWGADLQNILTDYVWTDIRVTDDIWKPPADTWTTPIMGTAIDLTADTWFDVDRTDRLRFTVRGVEFTTNDYCSVAYIPNGSYKNIAKVSYSYKMNEASQNWRMTWNHSYGGTAYAGTISTTTSSGTAITYTLNYPAGLELRFVSGATQTPGGKIYGEISDLCVYSGTVDTTLTQVCTDIVSNIGTAALNSDTNYIGSNTFCIGGTSAFGGTVPTGFFAEGWMPITEILTRAAGFGDASYNSWAVYTIESDKAAIPNGKAVLVAEQYPALTDYEYIINLNDDNLAGGVELRQDFYNIYNSIIVEYSDVDGAKRYAEPTMTGRSELQDADSIAEYGKRAKLLSIGFSSPDAAENYGHRYLLRHKDPQWVLDGSITLLSWIRAKDGSHVPVSHVRAGERIKIANYIMDQPGGGTGLTFIISSTSYDDSSETLQIGTGELPELIPPTMIEPFKKDDKKKRKGYGVIKMPGDD